MNTTIVEPYLFFGGRCEEAVEFYRKAIGAEVIAMMKFKDSPQPPPPGTMAPGMEDKVMHSMFRIGGSNVMASDGCEGPSNFQGFSLTITAPSEADAHRFYNALADGGQAKMPLSKTFWSPCFGVLTDKFGLDWMIMVLPN